METADEQTRKIEKQQSHVAGGGNNKKSHDREKNSNGPPKIVVYVVDVTHIEEPVLLKAKGV